MWVMWQGRRCCLVDMVGGEGGEGGEGVRGYRVGNLEGVLKG